MSLILNSEFHGVFAFFDSDIESRSADIESGTVMLESFSCIDLNINVINNDDIVRAVVAVKCSFTVALNVTYFSYKGRIPRIFNFHFSASICKMTIKIDQA